MKSEWKRFAVKAGAWAVVAALVHGMTVMFLGGPVEYLVPGILAAGAVYVWFIDRTPLPDGAMLKRGVALLFLAFAGWLAVPEGGASGIAWQSYAPELVEAAKRGGRPVLIDFTSRNCPPCGELDRKVFRRRRVVEEAAEFMALRADLTEVNDGNQKLAEQFRIEAFPTVVFLGTNGQERANLRLIGFERAEDFLIRLQQAR